MASRHRCSESKGRIMKRFTACAVVACACIIVGSVPSAKGLASAGPAADILAAEHGWAKAALDGDVATFASYMSPDYQEFFVESGAKTKPRWGISDKASWVALLRSKRETYTSVEIHNLKVYFHGNVASVTGEYSQKATSRGKDNSSSGLYVDTWVRTRERWQLISSVFP